MASSRPSIIVPTVGAAAGATLPVASLYFGADVMPLLRGQARTLPDRAWTVDGSCISFVGSNPGAFRSGRYKIVWPGWWANDAELYDLAPTLRDEEPPPHSASPLRHSGGPVRRRAERGHPERHSVADGESVSTEPCERVCPRDPTRRRALKWLDVWAVSRLSTRRSR